jgi:hypothetical protein
MPRAPYVVPVLGPQRENFGAPEQLTGKQQNLGGAKQALDLAAGGKWEVVTPLAPKLGRRFVHLTKYPRGRAERFL